MIRFTLLIVISILLACSSAKQVSFDFPDPVDTSDKPIKIQERKTYTIRGVSADNEFPGARLNDFSIINDTLYRAIISPENFPINPSAYYSFRIWSDTTRDISLQLFYTEHEHRYIPKLSYDGKHWIAMHNSDFDTLIAPNIAQMKLRIGPEKLWVSGQEVVASPQITEWTINRAKHKSAHFNTIGKSKLGRDLLHLDIYENSPVGKNTIVVLSRQHPPEVTGYYAMEAFIEEILADSRLSYDFRNSNRILVYPLLNPDGVDEGHWRHNAGGIDLNRDWSKYRQEEVAAVANHIINTTNRDKNKVLVGLDFHSTQQDLYYTLTDDLKTEVYDFKDYWLEGIDNAFDAYTPDDRPFGLNQPITKGWFFLQFGAEGITYEIGDETPRDFVREKGRVAARELMKLLILKEANEE